MGKANYAIHVSLQPEINKGAMAHYWNITINTEDGLFTIADGWGATPYAASLSANLVAKERGLVK